MKHEIKYSPAYSSLGVNQTTLLGAEAFFANKYIAEKGSGKVGFQFGKKL